jgi:hypothetical protein
MCGSRAAPSTWTATLIFPPDASPFDVLHRGSSQIFAVNNSED